MKLRTTPIGGVSMLLLGAFLSAHPASAQAPAAAPPASQEKSGSVTCPVNAQTAPPLSPALAAARDLYRTGKFDEAVAAYNAILPSGGADAAAAYAGIARVYLQQMRVADADAAAQKAVALTPGRAPAIVALGEVYFREGNLSESESSFLTPLRNCNLDARAYLGLTRLYEVLLDFKTAHKYIGHAFKLDPDDPDIRREYLDTLDGAERIEFLKKYLAGPTDDDTQTTTDMHDELQRLESKEKEGEHLCQLVTKVTQTEVKLEPLMSDATNLRGLGLRVHVNGASAKLMVDTGASGILIDKKVADRAGVKHLIDHGVQGIGDRAATSGYLGYADKIQIGELEFQGCYVSVVNTNSVLDDDGLIGANVFRSFLVDMNMPDRKFKLTQLPPYPDEPAAVASLQTESAPAHNFHNRYVAPEMKEYSPFLLFGHDILIPTHVNKSLAKLFLIDSGSWDSVLSAPFARAVTKISSDPDTTVKGLNGKVAKVYRTQDITLQFSRFTQKRDDLIAFDLTHISDDTGTEISGILGFTLLNLLDMKIDYRDGLVDFSFDPNRFH
jgi:tetratricopeptide (TPR) repeat protein